jgi:kumamolisin
MAASSRFASQRRVLLAGSEKKPLAGETDPAIAAAAQAAKAASKRAPKGGARMGRITVSVVMKPKTRFAMKRGRPQERLTRAAYASRHGVDPASVKIVRAFAREFGLTAETVLPKGCCTIHLSGSAAAMQKAFGVSLTMQSTAAGSFRVREGGIHIPEELEGHIVAVLGLDNRPQAMPHFRVAQVNSVSYTPVQVGALYGFPAGATASGQTIGIIELGGGYRAADLSAYFKTLGLAAPAVTAVAVDGGKNSPGNASGADGEVMLDIEVCGAVAPGAKIAVYFAPNTDQGFIDAVSMAVHDTANKPSVVSISWGGPELSWTGQATAALDAACQAAAAVGVTITVACGDNGSTDGVSGGGNNVDFPASSPHVVACGGTALTGSGTTITSEVVWNELATGEGATGGGVSTIFPLPTWQQNAGVPAAPSAGGGRGLPDVAGDADPSTGYVIRVDGQTTVIGGTSAVAPLWAGLIALANQANGMAVGFINPAIYAASAKKAFRDITQGNNGPGGYSAGPGWDACTGLGSPLGSAVIQMLGAAGAGVSTAAKKVVKKPAKAGKK